MPDYNNHTKYINILVVDDNESIRDTLGSLLEAKGYQVELAKNGIEALNKVKSKPFDLVITDLKLPKLDGLELLHKIKAFDPLVYVIIITGYSTMKTAVKALNAGASNFLKKPFDFKEIEKVVQKCLHNRYLILDNDENQPYPNLTTIRIPSKIPFMNSIIRRIIRTAELLNFEEEYSNVNIPLAMNEVLINAIKHGNNGDETCFVEIRILADDIKLQITICDEGNGFDVSKVPDPRHAPNLLKEGGRGLLLIKYYMDEVKFNEYGNEITIIKYRSSYQNVKNIK